ncbi:MAG: chromate efflux transporter [Pseudomonadota bacterium]
MNDLIRTFGRIGLLSFGGPAAQIALMHRVLVDEKDWLKEKEFLNALSFSMLLPGPEAMQLAIFAGWRRAGVPGGLIAGGLFVLPGAFVIMALATIYVVYGNVPFVDAIFLGVQATVVAIVLEALFKVTKRAIRRRADWAVAGLSFLAIFALSLPFPLIIALAALWGAFSAPADDTASATLPPQSAQANTVGTVAVWLALWFAPVAVLAALNASLLTDIALFFSKLAVVTFGGAYALLAYMTQTVVADFGWITTEEMMDGLGLAETTPGPLILVTQFVGFLAGYNEAGLGRGFLAAAVTLWVTFMPCFLWIFAGAPYVERLLHMPRLSGALHAITAAVVGVILNLSLWFSAHVVFRDIGTTSIGPFQFITPTLSSIDVLAAGIAVVSAVLLLRVRIGIVPTLAVGAALGMFSLLPGV